MSFFILEKYNAIVLLGSKVQSLGTFFTDASLHKPDGKNIMICGICVLPEYQKQGLARELVYNYCRREGERGRKRLILTCKQEKVKMYGKFGFRDLGEADSDWGGVKWHQMEIELNY